MFDKLIVLFATHILVDSLSQLDFLVSEGVLTQVKGMVIGHGSICGVDPDRFYPDAQTKSIVRHELGINQNATVLLFLGRLKRDKGMLDLAAAFAEISQHKPDTVLLLVGSEEDVPFTRIHEICGAGRDQLRRVSFTPNPERYMATADIFCLPSYREGFGQVIIEAAASGVPTVASRIYGITDAVEEGKTGLLFPAGNVAVLTKALLTLIEDQALRQKMGVAARLRAIELFASENITRELVDLYEEVMT
jgi:glycosyltransferase involved in cell wall biosynthesis